MNKVMLIGNVGNEPNVKYFAADQATAELSLATTERGHTLQNGTQVPDRTDWHTVIFNRNLAKIVERYVHKGDRIYVEGKLRYRSYDDQRGVRRFVTEIHADNMELLSPKPQRDNTRQDASNTTSNTQNGADNNKIPF